MPEEFAEITGIQLSSLKKYISGQVVYNMETLDTMATYLHCSYDYHLDKSHTPRRELQDLKEVLLILSSEGPCLTSTHLQ